MKRIVFKVLSTIALAVTAISVNAQQNQEPDYLCLTSHGNTSISVNRTYTGYDWKPLQLEYRINRNDWQQLSYRQEFDLQNNETIEFRCVNSGTNCFSRSNNEYIYFSTKGTGSVSASGNIMTLIDATGKAMDIPCEYCFYNLFSNCTNLITAPSLPATNLTASCYESMFSGCSNLNSNLPTLPARQLENRCYANMFSGCTSLEYLPNNFLPSNNLAKECYSNMFGGCKNLVELPTLPARQLAEGCYAGMFSGCSNIFQIPNNYLPAINLEERCYANMFAYCTGLTKLPSQLLRSPQAKKLCYAGMFSDCSSLQTIPEDFLPATELGEQCYIDMFHECTNLTTVPTNLLPATELAPGCYSTMFVGCLNLQNAPDLPAQKLEPSCYTAMFCNCKYIKNITVGFTEWLEGATSSWLYGTSKDGTFFSPSELDPIRGYSKIPQDWEIFIDYPDILTDYLCFTAIENSTFKLTKVGANWAAPRVVYRIGNNGNWIELDYNNSTPIQLKEGERVYFKAKNINSTFNISDTQYVKFELTGKINARGNINTLLSTKELFYALPSDYCFSNLFRSCTALQTMPELPSMILTKACYKNMFYGCSSLKNTAYLRATTLAESCYQGMFRNCNSLQFAELYAKTLVSKCCQDMFYNCTSLINIVALFNDWRDDINATTNWTKNVRTQGIFTKVNPQLPTIKDDSHIPTTWPPYKVTCLPDRDDLTPDEIEPIWSSYNGYANLQGASFQRLGFSQIGWSTTKEGKMQYEVNKEIPVNSDVTLYPVWEVDYFCLHNISDQRGTVSLAKVGKNWNAPQLSYKINDGEWINLTYDKDIVLNPSDKVYIKTSKDGINNFSISKDQYIHCKSTVLIEPSGNIMTLVDATGETKEIPNDYCFYRFLYTYDNNSYFYSARNLALPATTLKPHCYERMFEFNAFLVDAPYLPAENLVKYCYAYMFADCQLLRSLHVNFKEWTPEATLHWVNDAGTSNEWWAYMIPKEEALSKNFTYVQREVEYVRGYCEFISPDELEVKKGDSYIPINWSPWILTFKYGNETLPQKISKNGKFILTGESFTRNGSVQIGWSREIGGTKEYDLIDTIYEKTDFTLYPVWENGINIEGSPTICGTWQSNIYTITNAINGRRYEWNISNKNIAQITTYNNNLTSKIQSKGTTNVTLTLTITEYEDKILTAKESFDIQINQKPTLSAIEISGPNEISMCAVEDATFSVAETGEFFWQVPETATITSGQGTNKITVNFGTLSGNIFVYKQNGEGCTSYESKNKYVQTTAANCDKNLNYAQGEIPQLPITGDNFVCVNHNSFEYRNYDVTNKRPNCTYNWTLSENTSAVIAPYSNATGGNITVIWYSENEDVTLTVQEIINNLVVRESEYVISVRTRPYHNSTRILGPNTTTPNAIETYTVTSLCMGDEFYWIPTYGAEILSGQGTNTITVQFSQYSGNLIVYQQNGEGCRSFEQESQWVQLTTNYGSLKSYSIADNDDSNENEIENVSEQLEVILYPIPAKHVLNINTNATIEYVSILSNTGAEILREAETTKINVSNLPEGNYIVEIKTDKGFVRKQIVIIQ